MNPDPPCILFEDEHLLAINKPPGLNTHAPAPLAGEGIYDWLRWREPRWADLAIVHRLDKDTSGVLVFPKTQEACRSLTDQFTRRLVRKQYICATDRAVAEDSFAVTSSLRRLGDRYLSLPVNRQDPVAETRFRVDERGPGLLRLRAWPATGRTHQIRVHAAAHGAPLLGDTLYGGTPAARLWLHAEQLELLHPVSGEPLTLEAPADFSVPPWQALRGALFDEAVTDAWRWRHGAGDALPHGYVERWGEFLLLLCEDTPPQGWDETLDALRTSRRGVYVKTLAREVRGGGRADLSPRWLEGEQVPEEIVVQENGLRYAIRFAEGYSVGLFLDQRDNRQRLLRNRVDRDFPLRHPDLNGASVLNTFAYTCGFSVCAARAGARLVSVDLSRKYLDWGRHNFTLNGLPAEEHEFLYGDVFDWLRRFRKKARRFDVVLLDPPTFSTSRQGGAFQVRRDYPRLVEAAAALVGPGGVLFCSTNAAQWGPESFLEAVGQGLNQAGRKAVRRHFCPQPPDFPVTRAEPAYLKTVWLRLD